MFCEFFFALFEYLQKDWVSVRFPNKRALGVMLFFFCLQVIFLSLFFFFLLFHIFLSFFLNLYTKLITNGTMACYNAYVKSAFFMFFFFFYFPFSLTFHQKNWLFKNLTKFGKEKKCQLHNFKMSQGMVVFGKGSYFCYCLSWNFRPWIKQVRKET